MKTVPRLNEIKLTQGQVAIIDATDYERLSQRKWFAQWNSRANSFYATRSSASTEGKRHAIPMHREILGLERGDKRQGDHLNGDTLDNRRCNLRVATHSENARNRRIQGNNTSGFKGVHWDKANRKWRAQIKINSHKQYLGLFDNPEDAAGAYDFAAITLHGDFAHLNFTRTGGE